MKGAPESMRISGFMHGVNNPELTKRLNEHVPKTMEEMMTAITAFIRGETAIASKKKGHASWKPQNQPKRHVSERRSDFRGRDQPKVGKKEAPLKDKSAAIYMGDRRSACYRSGNWRAHDPPHVCRQGSLAKILYEHCFNRLRPKIKSQMVPTTTSLSGFSGETIWPLGQLRLLVIIGDAQHSTQAWMNFMIVRSLSPYNGIIGRPEIREIQAVPSTAHGMLKFPVDGGIVTIRSTIFIPIECATVTMVSKEAEVCHENFKVALHLNFPDQEVAIGGPSDMTGVPRSVAEHRLSIREGYPPVCQKKRGQDPERARAIQVEVQKLVETGIMKEVYYHDWLSNLVMVKSMTVDRGCRWQNQMKRKRLSHTSHGVYCYTKMSFGLKNAGATYQRLVDKAFNSQVGRNIEVAFGHPVTLSLGVSLILIGLRKEYDGFVQNYNMHSMGKTVNELHAMLKLHEQTLPKNSAPAVHAIRASEIQKVNKHKKPQPQMAARGQNHGKVKNKLAYAPNPKIPPPPKREDSAKDSVCHECGIFVIELNTILNRSWSYDTGCGTHICNTTQGLRASRKLKPRALSFSIYAISNKRAKLDLDSALLWHCFLGHISKKRIEKLQHDGLLNSTDLKAFEKCVPSSGSLEDHEIIQEEDTHPSIDTSLNHEEDDLEIDEPQRDLGEPTNYKAALLDPESDKWLNAMNVKMQSKRDNEVWVLVKLPPNGKTVGSKWLFKKKTVMDGAVHTYKARLVANGYTQTLGIDYEETFSPVADVRAIRILIAIAAYYDYEIWQMDVKIAFLNGYLSKKVYMEQLEGFVNPKYPNWEAVWVRKFISGLGVVSSIEEPISMYCDNTKAIAIANESGITKGARHFHAKVITFVKLLNMMT
nr:reverse transcriptase domain-containing protein [Tanacetum cinerariifolium]